MPGPLIRVVLVDRNAAFRRTLRNRIAVLSDIQVVAETESERCVPDLVARYQPDVVTLDAQEPSMARTELIRQLHARGSMVGILVLLASDDAPSIKAAMDAGANGYVLRSAPIDEIVQELREVYESNQVYIHITRFGSIEKW